MCPTLNREPCSDTRMSLARAPAGPAAGPGDGAFAPPVSCGNGTNTTPSFRVSTIATFGGVVVEWCCAAPAALNPTQCICSCWHCETTLRQTLAHAGYTFTFPMPRKPHQERTSLFILAQAFTHPQTWHKPSHEHCSSRPRLTVRHHTQSYC